MVTKNTCQPKTYVMVKRARVLDTLSSKQVEETIKGEVTRYGGSEE